jgi:hypothetical protein
MRSRSGWAPAFGHEESTRRVVDRL